MVMKTYILILSISILSPIITYCQCNGSIELCSKKYNEVAYLTHTIRSIPVKMDYYFQIKQMIFLNNLLMVSED